MRIRTPDVVEFAVRPLSWRSIERTAATGATQIRAENSQTGPEAAGARRAAPAFPRPKSGNASGSPPAGAG